jgi:hypothetical protein
VSARFVELAVKSVSLKPSVAVDDSEFTTVAR